ncbi:MAG: transposase [Desulfocapsaceae bacterium]|nr:transposase [Desulfocapsaceae bacterium]
MSSRSWRCSWFSGCQAKVVKHRESGFWHSSRIDFFLPVRALSEIFRAKFRDKMKKAGLFDQIDSSVWQLPWNVNSQAVGSKKKTKKRCRIVHIAGAC